MDGRRVESVQVLRGIAATLVVLLHAIEFNPAPPDLPGALQRMGAAGVDLFFVISGFAMSCAMERHAGRPGPFLRDRLLRIAPLFYLLTAGEIIRREVAGEGLGWQHVANSLTFVPAASGWSYHLPYVKLGWTLAFEFAFYAVVAAVLAARRGHATLLVAVLALAALPSGIEWAALRWPTNDIMIEFGFGIAAYLLWRIGFLTRRRARTMLWAGLAWFAILATAEFPPVNTIDAVTDGSLSALRVLLFGVPSFLVLAGLLDWHPVAGRALGDASYSTYLVHPLILAPIVGLLPGWLGVIVGVPVTLLVCWRFYLLVEAPLTALIRRPANLQAVPENG